MKFKQTTFTNAVPISHVYPLQRSKSKCGFRNQQLYTLHPISTHFLKVRVSERLASGKNIVSTSRYGDFGPRVQEFSGNLETTLEFSAPEKRH